ncbi:MAG: CRTAC1 family protein [Anaerolineae bacterium]
MSLKNPINRLKSIWFVLVLPALFLLLSACQQAEPVRTADAIKVDQTLLDRPMDCTGAFTKHTLDHITTNAYEPIDMYDSNGAGVAVNDLDQDGDVDIVLANLAGDNQIFWNLGRMNFRPEAFDHGSSRAVSTVDVDGDGWLDIVFTTRVGSLIYYKNLAEDWSGEGFRFDKTPLVGVSEKAYAMAWDDLDGDGDLDLVTGSYDTALEKELRDSFMFGDGAGVFVFTNEGDHFTSERLADASQALAIQVMDLNFDGRKDILVGNDFDSVKDYYFLAQANGSWEQVSPFGITTQNTMSFDLGDINNDGKQELFAADMHPYKFDEETEAEWAGVMEMMMMDDQQDHTVDNPQIMENVLQAADEDGNWQNMAAEIGINFSGWSWSSRFADLDHNGFQDLYIVNGMATSETFSQLPDYELVEENQAFRNVGDSALEGKTQFEPAPNWELGQTEGGRGMTLADLDNDGDLDIVINNLLKQATLLENRVCGGDSLIVELHDSSMQNRFAIGSKVVLETSVGRMVRDVRVNSGYLSGDTVSVHFGLPRDAEIISMEIEWPDGAVSTLSNVSHNQKIVIER